MPRVDRGRIGRGLLLLYLVALLSSHLWRSLRAPELEQTLAAIEVEDPTEQKRLHIAMRGEGAVPDSRPLILLLHGSPGDSGIFTALLEHADPAFRWLAVDLPGFGESAADLRDYSFAAHARHVELLLDELRVGAVHVVAFSLGGGVALSLYERDPERVASLVLLSSIGVQELELLGDYRLNHLLHGVQLGALWLLREAIPHFGHFDPHGVTIAFGRNFYDSDQRPLRSILERFEPPMLIVHGRRDPLVPPAAAREHHRIVAQSRLLSFEEGHFLPWQRPRELAQAISDFARAAESGAAPRRQDAEPARMARAQLDFAELPQPQATGLVRLILIALLVLGTFVAEDLSCLSAGILIAQGRLDLLGGLAACAGGIFFGDLWLYFAGRLLGERVLRLRILRPVLDEFRLHRAERWFARRGLLVILLTRFVPGARLPTYVAAGVLRTNFWRFASYFLLAVLLWTPLIVLFARAVGASALDRLEHLRYAGSLLLLLFGVAMLIGFRVVLPALSHRGRRRLLGSLQRLRRWEFWPPWIVYGLLSPALLWLMVRHGGVRGVTAVNPGIENGGLLGESKASILSQLDGRSGMLPAWTALPAGEDANARLLRFEEWRVRDSVDYPIVLKPDVGERGRGVQIVRDEASVRAVFDTRPEALIAQRFVDGLEFGVFYVREVGAASGRILSINSKELPALRGDGRRSLRDLILDDERAVCLADVYLEQNRDRLDWIPEPEQSVRLVELGTHCRGAIFRDARNLSTPQLLAALERVLNGFEDFAFGRFDLRVPSVEALRAGQSLSILELNGLSSEAAHVYEPGFPLREGLRTLYRQWKLAFEIASAQRRRGHRPASWGELYRALRRSRIGT